MISFGGTGTEILMFRAPFEKELERIDRLMQQIDYQQGLVDNTAASIRKIFDDDIVRFKGDLEKVSGATDFRKNLESCLDLIAKGHEQLAKLKQLMAECREAQTRAKAALPDYTIFATNGRLDVPPSRPFFVATKNAGEAQNMQPFEPSAHKRQDDPLAILGSIQLGRRFRNRSGKDGY